MRFLFLLLLGFTFFACGSQGTTAAASQETETQEQPTEKTEETPSETATIQGEGYTIKVLKDGIPSPRKEMSTNLGGSAITINYGSPSVKGRELWGGLEPYDEVWRTGANEATTIEFSAPVKIEGKALAAGKYSLFTIPRKAEWVVIFNSEPEQFGDYNYDDAKDVLRVQVTPGETEHVEAMEFVTEGDAVVLKWGTTAVPFKVTAS